MTPQQLLYQKYMYQVAALVPFVAAVTGAENNLKTAIAARDAQKDKIATCGQLLLASIVGWTGPPGSSSPTTPEPGTTTPRRKTRAKTRTK